MILSDAIAEKVTPGAAFGVLHNKHAYSAALGHFTYDPGSPAVTPETIYDVASLTKVVATTSHGDGPLRPRPTHTRYPARNHPPRFQPTAATRSAHQVTLRMLLTTPAACPRTSISTSAAATATKLSPPAISPCRSSRSPVPRQPSPKPTSSSSTSRSKPLPSASPCRSPQSPAPQPSTPTSASSCSASRWKRSPANRSTTSAPARSSSPSA